MHDEKESVVASDDVHEKPETRVVRQVYEQRWSAFLHAGAILAFTRPPLQRVLGLTPTSVLAGLFMFMGEQSLSVNPILQRVFHALSSPSDLPPLPPQVSNWRAVHGYTITQVTITAVIFAITLTKAAPAFPLLVIACVPARLFIMNHIWNKETLDFVDKWACRGLTSGNTVDQGDSLEN